MTNKEAIDMLNILKFRYRDADGTEFRMALDLAIKALEAPTVDTYTEDDVKIAIKEGHEVGYEMAKAKYERPTGEWIETFTSHTAYECSCCGLMLSPEPYAFCPNCGAKMIKEAENE